MALPPNSTRLLISVVQISAFCATLGILSGCVVEDRPHHRDRVVVEEAPPPPPPPPVVEYHRPPPPRVEIVIEHETPPPPPRFVIVERDGPPPPVHVVAVHAAPPPPRHEIQPKRPSPNHVWLDGHYRYVRGSYVWTPGRWELPPRANVHYIAPHWEHRAEGHVFIEGYWKL